MRRSRATSWGGAVSWVRRMPGPPFSIIRAAAIPVMRETCSFQPSTANGAR